MRALTRPVDSSPLALFRVLFGVLMCVDAALALIKLDWLKTVFAPGVFHFKYAGFGWVPAPPESALGPLCALAGLAALGLASGAFARASAASFFLLASWALLLDRALYVNHHYLICLLAFLLAWAPAARTLSVDAALAKTKEPSIPAYWLWLFRLQIALVYLFAGLSKLDGDWLNGLPLKLWIEAEAIGGLPLLDPSASGLVMSWAGLSVDLLAGPALLWPRTRTVAVIITTLFHLLNALWMKVGVFPYMMMASSVLFLDPTSSRRPHVSSVPVARVPPFFFLWLFVQIVLPLRPFLYPGDSLWTNRGHLFSWRLLLRDKDGELLFFARDGESGAEREIDPLKTLPGFQIRPMLFDPELIRQYAAHLAGSLRAQGWKDPEIRALAMVSLNGRAPAPLIDPTVDLAVPEPRPGWIMPSPRR